MSQTPATIEMIHDRLYHMAKAVIAVLEKHDIPYSLAYGTLLGAVRHQGFIPWDDDFDLWLFEDSYDEAMEYLRNELPDDMFLEDEKSEPIYFHGWAHVKDLNSVATHALYPQDDAYAHKGLHIDLYRCTRMKESERWNYLNNENRKYLQRRKDKGLISEEDYNARMEKIIKSEAEHASDVSSDRMIFQYLGDNLFAYEEDVLPLVRYKFEGAEYYGFNNADNVLTGIYGDYMTLPPEEDRHIIHSGVYFTN